jgi:hypothetical protein
MDLERRMSARKPVNQEVMIIHSEGHRLCQIHNLSLNGAMLKVGWGALYRDVPVQMTISLPASKQRLPYRLSASVARVTKDGTAIKFHDLDPNAKSALQLYLQAAQ